MGPVLDLKGRTETTMEASTSKDHTIVVQTPKDKNMRSESNHERSFDTGTSLGEKVPTNEEIEVDIINCMTDDEDAPVQSQSGDATGSSSSFGDTFSQVGNHEYESDEEVMSGLHADAGPLQGFGGSGGLFPVRKRRLTSHWRKYIRPLMWRCKWVELQIKKFQSQAIKYDRELEKHYQMKLLKHRNFELGVCARSTPFSHDSHREKPLKRKIRKKHEELDTEAYMSQHNLFSYFANRRSTIGGATMNDDQTNPATSADMNARNEFRVPDELLSLDFRDDYSLEQMLWKIEVAQSQVCNMKTRLSTLMTENAARIPSIEELNLHESNNAIRESASPTNRDGSSVVASFASELMKYNTGDDLIKSEDAVLSHEEETHLQDEKQHIEQPPVAPRKRSTEGILIYNRRAKKPQTDSGPVKVHPIEKLQIPKEEENNNVGPALVSEDSSHNEQPAPKLRSVSKLTAPSNKRKRAARARRKSGSSLWTRRTSG